MAFVRGTIITWLAGAVIPTFEELHRELFWNSRHVFQHYSNPYKLRPLFDKFPHSNLTPEFFADVIDMLPFRPQLVVEVGSLYGHSAISIATSLDALGMREVPVLCMDPWSGDLNMLLQRHKDFAVNYWSAPVVDGRALTFDQFMVNVQFSINRTISPSHILPVHATSIVGARWLKELNYAPEIIFIDSAHEIDETLMELKNFWEVLAPGGMMFGDDFSWTGVKHDVTKFVESHPESLFQILNAGKDGRQHPLWLLQKPRLDADVKKREADVADLERRLAATTLKGGENQVVHDEGSKHCTAPSGESIECEAA